MATFLTAIKTSAAIEDVIRGAKKELTLISAYVQPRVIYIQRLKDAAARGVKITLIYGKARKDREVVDLFKEVDGISIYFLDVLHAKCFLNENEAVVTSLNLLNGSEERNREMGVRLDRTTDTDAYNECVDEMRSVLSAAVAVNMGPRQAEPIKAFPKKGVCIRCAVALPCDPDRPLCTEDFKNWVKYKNPDYQEHHCHTCGKKGPATMAQPLCTSCTAKYASALRALDAKKEHHSVFYRNTWRRPVVFT